MKQHHYKITVEHVTDAKGEPSTYDAPMIFDAYNHDDLFKVLEKIQEKNLFDEDKTKAFAVGLKLFGETLLENKANPLFKEFLPEFIEFMTKLKSA